MEALFTNLVGLGVPGVLTALTVWYTRRLDDIRDNALKLMVEDRDRWHARAIQCEAELFEKKRHNKASSQE